jgi:hypothetical protein
MLGILSNPVVTLMWFLEQAEVHVFGSTPRASDIRIVMSFCVNSAIVIGMYFVYINMDRFDNAIILGVVLAWVSSHNMLFNIGMLK